MPAPAAFTGSIPATYDRLLGPLLFEPYARDMVERLRLRPGERALELACGTGIVTQHLAAALPERASLTATDLNEPMLAVARARLGSGGRAVTLRQADGCDLPFADRSFDAIACQFGVMFFPDKTRAMHEARRVLAPGGRYVFSVWESLEHNPMTRAVHETVCAMYPANPPKFFESLPHGYHDRAEIERTVRAAGFTSVGAEVVEFRSIAPSADDAACALIEGTPLLMALRERGVTDTGPVRSAASAAIARACGERPCRAMMRALVVTLG